MKTFYRSRTNRKLGGVCGGIGEYFSIDPSIIRFLVFALAIFTAVAPAALVYIVLWIIAPEAPIKKKKVTYKKLYRSSKNKVLGGVCGGFAEFCKLDATLIRALYIILMILTAIFPLLILYIFALMIIPPRPNKYDPIEIEID